MFCVQCGYKLISSDVGSSTELDIILDRKPDTIQDAKEESVTPVETAETGMLENKNIKNFKKSNKKI